MALTTLFGGLREFILILQFSQDYLCTLKMSVCNNTKAASHCPVGGMMRGQEGLLTLQKACQTLGFYTFYLRIKTYHFHGILIAFFMKLHLSTTKTQKLCLSLNDSPVNVP